MKKAALSITLSCVMAGSLAFACPASAQVSVTQAWVRATVPAQRATGAFMQIVAPEGGRLVEAASPVANVVEIHEMAMDGEVMKMRPVTGLDLPAGQTVALRPGGYHVMLIDLKAQVKEGDEVPLALVIEGRDGLRQRIELHAPARALNAAPAPMPMGGGHPHGMSMH